MITEGNYPKWIKDIQTKKQKKQEETAGKAAESLQQGLTLAEEPERLPVRSKPRRKVIIEESESDSGSEEEVIIRKKKSSSKSKSKSKSKPSKSKKQQESSSEAEDVMEEDEEPEPTKYKNLSKYLRK